jgi:pantoate--beta-alanine ligase
VIVLERIREVRDWRARQGQVGLVPTMGFLHQGHLSLVRRAHEDTGAAAASIFVNPTQFGPGEDLARYPRDLPRDLDLLARGGCAMAFVPDAAEMYPEGYQTWVEVGEVAQVLEGARRPGHFRGVATVVAKLFEIVRPEYAYFGQKDAQQLAVIRTMVRDLDMGVRIVACPTVREPGGLAMSSRNTYLSAEERQAARVLYRALTAAADSWRQGERDAERLRRTMREVLGAEPLARPEYVSVADPVSLRELDRVADGALLSMAVGVGPARLIDNLLLGQAQE